MDETLLEGIGVNLSATLSKIEIGYYGKNVENQAEALQIEIRNQRALKKPGSDEAIKILEEARSHARALFSSWNAIERLFYPAEQAESA